MMQLTRREFLAAPGALAVPLLLGGGQTPAEKRNLLTSAWPAAMLAEALIPRERFHPFPTASSCRSAMPDNAL